MFFSFLIFFVTMYIFLSADGKIAYFYDDVIFICSSDYFLYQKYVYRNPSRRSKCSFSNKINWNQPIGKKKKEKVKKKKNGVKIIMFKTFRLKILFVFVELYLSRIQRYMQGK